MPAHGFLEPMTDGDIDRALGAALAVEPSPQFLARVRMRIAREPAPSGCPLSWVFAAGASTAAIALAVIVSTQINHPPLSAGLPSAVGGFSFLPALLPGSLAVAASAPRRSGREKPAPEMRAVMQSNAAATLGLAAHAKARDYDAIVNDATALKQNFVEIQSFWTARQMDDPVAITHRSLEAVATLDAAARARDDAAIRKGIAALEATCVLCHKQYRERLPDDTFEIRL